ncbi:MAG: hypothetical protein R3C53_13165 [Pirellulaceae bacterium]
MKLGWAISDIDHVADVQVSYILREDWDVPYNFDSGVAVRLLHSENP